MFVRRKSTFSEVLEIKQYGQFVSIDKKLNQLAEIHKIDIIM